MADKAVHLAPVDTALAAWASDGFRRISLIRLVDGIKLIEWKQEQLDIDPARSLFAGPFCDWHKNAYEYAARAGLLVRD